MNTTPNLFRLIKPVSSNKVYESKTIMHGAGKCYKELKTHNIKASSFSIIEINQNQVYTFKINSKSNANFEPKIESLVTNNQNGGLNQKVRDDFMILKKLEGLEKNIQNLNIRINKLESSNSSKPLEKV